MCATYGRISVDILRSRLNDENVIVALICFVCVG